MILFLVAYLDGILTIASPCILPVLPFVFARADRSFVRSGLPTLATMALTFAVVAGLATVAGGWAVEPNRYGRFVTSLALALAAGGRVFAMMKRSLGVGQWIKRGLGIVVLLAVAAIGLELDTGLLTRVSVASTAVFEQRILDTFRPDVHPASDAVESKRTSRSEHLRVEAAMPTLSGAIDWLNSPPLTTEGLRGKVVMVDFWTYSCINCLRMIPYVWAWAEK